MSQLVAGRVRLRIDLGYDGTAFHGWAVQPGLRTVQQTIEEAIAVICGPVDPPRRLTVAGRTDAGVHARGQVAHIDLPEELAARVTESRLTAILRQGFRRGPGAAFVTPPIPDVVIYRVATAAPGFDARYAALSRRYEYRIRPESVRPDPLSARFTADMPFELDLQHLQRASNELVGLQDFTTFCKARVGSTAVRDLSTFQWSQDDRGVLIARIEADAFCHSMVRALVGSVVATASGRISMSDLVMLRDARERTSHFAVMPARGLSLEKIEYPADSELADRANLTRARRAPAE